jgi:hypothetical protein
LQFQSFSDFYQLFMWKVSKVHNTQHNDALNNDAQYSDAKSSDSQNKDTHQNNNQHKPSTMELSQHNVLNLDTGKNIFTIAYKNAMLWYYAERHLPEFNYAECCHAE